MTEAEADALKICEADIAELEYAAGVVSLVCRWNAGRYGDTARDGPAVEHELSVDYEGDRIESAERSAVWAMFRYAVANRLHSRCLRSPA